jgi:uncharacterized protein YidB (DUF937 family)
MSKGSPSMVALLGLLAVAGYQNRDKLAGLLQQGGTGVRPRGPDSDSGQDGLPFTRQNSADEDGGILGGLADLLSRFTNPVQSAKARTWVDRGPNGDLAPEDLEEVLDPSTMDDLMQQTGLGRAELLQRLSAILPEAVDRMTPEGRLPTIEEARGIY